MSNVTTPPKTDRVVAAVRHTGIHPVGPSEVAA